MSAVQFMGIEMQPQFAVIPSESPAALLLRLGDSCSFTAESFSLSLQASMIPDSPVNLS
jgi:hypothetical protein